ncbi:MAG: type II toxin-antitoxin system RelE/ParE family toxin [Campylobacterota bacterium]|nr:type II toxin-antitoxin system RelE/ParE family toxin [Campylobacterota bacterium]
MKATFLDAAISELNDTFRYYELQQTNLGHRFVAAVKESVELIEYYPKGWHCLSPNIRRCLVKNFPYGVIYQIKDDNIFILAISNLHRKPNYWENRVS